MERTEADLKCVQQGHKIYQTHILLEIHYQSLDISYSKKIILKNEKMSSTVQLIYDTACKLKMLPHF